MDTTTFPTLSNVQTFFAVFLCSAPSNFRVTINFLNTLWNIYMLALQSKLSSYNVLYESHNLAQEWESSHLLQYYSHQRSTTPSPCYEIIHDLPTDGVLPLLWCHSKSPSKPIPCNHVTDRIHSSTAPYYPLHFLLKLRGSRFNFCIDLVQKKGPKKSDQRSTKSFPLNQSK